MQILGRISAPQVVGLSASVSLRRWGFNPQDLPEAGPPSHESVGGEQVQWHQLARTPDQEGRAAKTLWT